MFQTTNQITINHPLLLHTIVWWWKSLHSQSSGPSADYWLPPLLSHEIPLILSHLWQVSDALERLDSATVNGTRSMMGSSLSIFHTTPSFINSVPISLMAESPYQTLVGGLNPSEKYERQLGWLATQYMGKCQKWQPNHQPETCVNHHLTICACGCFFKWIQFQGFRASRGTIIPSDHWVWVRDGLWVVPEGVSVTGEREMGSAISMESCVGDWLCMRIYIYICMYIHIDIDR